MVFAGLTVYICDMTARGKIAAWLAVGLALQSMAVVRAADPNPYSAIVDRNVFNLKAPPPPTPSGPPPTPPSKIVLLGIVSGFGPKQVMFKTPVGAPPKDMSFALGEGERDNEIEVVEINELAGTVKLRNHGEEENLSLEKDGMKPGGAPAPGVPFPGVPGQRVPPPMPLPGLPGASPSANVAPPGGSTITTFGNGASTVARPLRVSTSASGTPGVGGVGGYANPNGNGISIGNTFVSGTGANNNNVTPQVEPHMSQEEQMIRMEINRKLTQQQVDAGNMPPLPPTPLTGK